MNVPDRKRHLILSTFLVLLFGAFFQNVNARLGADSEFPELPEPTDPPVPQPGSDTMDKMTPCVSIGPKPVIREPAVGYVSEPGMPFGFSIGPSALFSDECIAFLRDLATGEGVAVIGISLKGDGSDVMKMTIRDGAPDGTTFIRNANGSATETLGFGAWSMGDQVWHITVGPNSTDFANGVWLREPGLTQPSDNIQSSLTAQTIFFDRPVWWWFDPEAYWSPDTFWKMFSGKLVDFTYIGN